MMQELAEQEAEEARKKNDNDRGSPEIESSSAAGRNTAEDGYDNLVSKINDFENCFSILIRLSPTSFRLTN